MTYIAETKGADKYWTNTSTNESFPTSDKVKDGTVVEDKDIEFYWEYLDKLTKRWKAVVNPHFKDPYFVTRLDNLIACHYEVRQCTCLEKVEQPTTEENDSGNKEQGEAGHLEHSLEDYVCSKCGGSQVLVRGENHIYSCDRCNGEGFEWNSALVHYPAIDREQPVKGEETVTNPMDSMPVLVEAFSDNGEFSHWRLVDRDSSELLWTECPEEDEILYTGFKALSSPSVLQENREELDIDSIYIKWYEGYGDSYTLSFPTWFKQQGFKITNDKQ